MFNFTCVLLLILIPVYCVFADEQRRLLVDYDMHQLQLDVQYLKAKVSTLENKVKVQEVTIQKMTVSTGAFYTRWGRVDCPTNGTTLVYTGFAAGGNHDDSGAAAEYVCLSHNPNFNLALKSTNGDKALIFGAEYQDNVFGNNFLDKDVPCAVCLASSASSILMVPGKSECVSDLKMEYKGILVSQGSYASYFHAAGQYICVDHDAQPLEGGFEDKNGKLFYPVHARCGSLRCPPYIEDAILTCVVCSK